jgi:superfamily II DNA/RNA helicase
MKLPDNVDEYLHKAGRTGRLGRKGKAITFVSTEENFVVQRFSNELGVPIHKRAIKSVKKTEEKP